MPSPRKSPIEKTSGDGHNDTMSNPSMKEPMLLRSKVMSDLQHLKEMVQKAKNECDMTKITMNIDKQTIDNFKGEEERLKAEIEKLSKPLLASRELKVLYGKKMAKLDKQIDEAKKELDK